MKAKTYVVQKTSAMEAWDYVDTFSGKMDKFVEKNPKFSYTAIVENTDDLFQVIVKVIEE